MIRTISEKVEAKLRKLLALADRGEGGEKDNARRMLDKMLERHGLTIDDLVDERREIRWFPLVHKYDRQLANQILAKVCDTHYPTTWRNKERPKQIGVEVTPAEAIEFELHYETLRKALIEHFDIAYAAFVQANRIYPSTRSDDSDESLSERDMQVVVMASAISPTPVNPRLGQEASHD